MTHMLLNSRLVFEVKVFRGLAAKLAVSVNSDNKDNEICPKSAMQIAPKFGGVFQFYITCDRMTTA